MSAMKNRTFPALCLIFACLFVFCSCANRSGLDGTAPPSVDVDNPVDYAASVRFDPNSGAKHSEVTVHSYIDGDTTHFTIPENVYEGGLLKARYIAVNTPESTGKIEEWGKKASKFTKEKLSTAAAIMVESDTASWDIDSTGSRCLVWVWYKADASSDWRNLNIELLQNGLAIASSAANNRYGSVCVSAIDQAKAQKLNIYSGQKDPDFFYGDAVELSLSEIRRNPAAYSGQKVAFEGVVTINSNNGVYVEELDPELEIYNGMYVYYGFGLTGEGLEILSVGNRVRVVGTLQFYETGGTWQVSGITYRQMKPDDPGNIQKLGEGYEPAFAPIDAQKFNEGTLSVTDEDGNRKEYRYAELLEASTVSATGLTVRSVYTTETEGSSSKGAMTLTCVTDDGCEIKVRTVVLYDADGKLVTSDRFEGKTIDVKGVVDYYNGGYQIKVVSVNHVTVH